MAQSSTTDSPQRESVTNFGEFCELMTRVAENQLDMHRATYYPICVSLFHEKFIVTHNFFILIWQKDSYSKIMECYRDPRQTNEETDACASIHRDRM